MEVPAKISAFSARLTLRFKLIGGFSALIVLILLAGSFSLLSQHRALSAMKSYLDRDDKIGDLSLQSKSAMLKARRLEKDFLLKIREFGFFEARSRYATLLQAELSDIHQDMAAIRGLRADPEIAKLTLEIDRSIERYGSGFMEVVELHGRLGRVDNGLEGAFREKAHEIEAILKRRHDDKLMSDLLALRRAEKDFLMRGLDKYAKEVARAAATFKEDVARAGLPYQTREKLWMLADGYRTLFDEYVEVKAAANTRMLTFLYEVGAVEPMLERLRAHSNQTAVATRDTVQRLTRLTGWTIVAASLLAILAGSMVAFFTSRSITRSVKGCMDFAGRFAGGDLTVRMEAGGDHEFGRLAAALNRMADELQGHRLLQEERTAELAGANSALENEIAEHRDAEEALRQRQRAIDASSNGIMITDALALDHPIIYVNPAFERITGYAASEVLGRNPRLLCSGDREQLGLEVIRVALCEQREGHAELRNYRKDGSLFWNALSVSPVLNAAGAVTNYVGIVNDITERKRYEEQLEYQSNHDGLTGLPNRNLLEDRIGQVLTYAERYQRQTAVFFVDLDHFKFINDSLGHDVGDKLLRIAARRLSECVRSIDTVARHGGDEFVIVLSDLAVSEDAAKVARKIQDAVCRPYQIGEHELIVSCSTGISLYPKDGSDAQVLLKNADVAMYRAKQRGRNNFQFYTCELNDIVLARLTMEKHLRRALERDELLVHYQPKVDLASGRITGMEALVRWQSPELGFISPASFIPLAEETGLIVAIGEWVLRTACAQNKAWQEGGLPPMVVAVNLSPRQFRQEGLAETVRRIAEETGLAARYIELEIVESLLMDDVDGAVAMLDALKELGVQLTMDDFGTGYSSLSYLKRFPFDKMKIDQSFVRDITRDPGSAAIVRTVISLAHTLNLRVVAEGVETEGQLAYLRGLACDEMQGFYFSRPVPAEEFEQMLRDQRHLVFATEPDRRQDNTILLVDDEASVVASLRRLLSDEGYDILSTTSAMEGFELLATNRVGVVVSDLRMSEMSGTEFLSRVRELYPDTVRIMLSGRADMPSLSDAINHGAIFKFFIKPWEGESLRESIGEAFRCYADSKVKSV